MRRIILLGAVLASTLVVAACDNTIRGVGRDLREAGQATRDVVR